MADELPGVDIVMGVHNQPHFVEACLESLVRCTDEPDWTLYLIDDLSDAYTASRLEHWQTRCDRIRLLRNETNLGFIGTYNRGLKAGSAKYVVLLNSDTVLTPGWLARMVRAAEADPRVALVNPLTNKASNLSVSMVPGSSAFAMGEVLHDRLKGWTFETITAVGFCLLVRRAALERHGYLDEAFGQGYAEESDLHMRLVTQEWRAIAAADAYVYHRGEGSFPSAEGQTRREENLALFFKRWEKPYWREVARCRLPDAMSRVNDSLCVTGSRGYGRLVGDGLQDAFRALSSGHPLRAFYHFGLRMDRSRHRNRYPARSHLERHAGRRKPSVLFVLPRLADHPDVAHILDLAHWLNIQGMEVRVAAVRPSPPLPISEACLEPIRFLGPEDFLSQAPDSDVAIAMDPSVRECVQALVARGRARESLYWDPYLACHEEPSKPAERNGPSLRIHYAVDTDLFYPAVSRDGERRLLVRSPLHRHDVNAARHIVQSIRRELPGLKVSLLFATDRTIRPVYGPWDRAVAVHDRPGWGSEYRKGDVLLWLDRSPSTQCLLEGLSAGLACVCVAAESKGSCDFAKASSVVPVESMNAAALGQAVVSLFKDENRLLEACRSARQLAEKHGLRSVVPEWERLLRAAAPDRTRPKAG